MWWGMSKGEEDDQSMDRRRKIHFTSLPATSIGICRRAAGEHDHDHDYDHKYEEEKEKEKEAKTKMMDAGDDMRLY